MLWGLLIRFKSIFIKLKPDADLLKNVLSSEVYAKPSINSILPVHSIGNYLGDIFGYFKFLANGGPNFLGKQSQLIGKTVFSKNIGRPVVVCIDHLSAEAVFANVDNLTQGHMINLVCSRQSKPIFTTHGPEAQNARKFIISLLPQDETEDKFQDAINSVHLELDRWASLSKTKINKMSLEEAVGDLIFNYAGCLMLGSPLDKTLINRVFPTPNFLPVFPVIPTSLLPSYYTMQLAMNEIFDQVKQYDNWDQVLYKASAVTLSEREAFEQLFTAITFNALGLSNSLLNGILLSFIAF